MAKDEAQKKDRLFVGSVEKAFSVLEAFGKDRPDLGMLDIMQRTDLPKSAAQRYIHTLCQLGYLQKDPSSRRFSLSIKVLEAANSFLMVDPLVSRAMPFVFDLRAKIDGRVGMGCLHGTEAMYLIPLQSNRTAFHTSHAGFRIPVYCTTTGRILLSFQNDDQILRTLEQCELKRVTEHTKIDPQEILAEVQKARAQGYSITEQEIRLGALNLAAPIVDGSGAALGAIAVSVSIADWNRKSLVEEIVPVVMETVRDIVSGS